MKKILTYIAALAALLTLSCNRIEFDGNDGGEGTLTISLSASDLETRAQTTEEATIDHFDYFFFANSDGTGLITSARVTGTTKTFDTTSQEFKALSGKSYLYVIANYPEAIPSTSTTTLQDLLALPVQVAITSYPSTPFVMDSYDADKDNVLIELTPTAKNEVRNQVVKMRRIAAKFVVNITVAASVNTGTDSAPVYWKPTTTTKDFYIYMVNSFIDATSTGALISGAPISIAGVTDPTKFYTYSHKHADMTRGSDDLHWTSADYYSYPVTFTSDNQKAPYFKIQIPWVNVKNPSNPATGSNIDAMGTHMFYYKVMLPEITTITRNTLYTLNVTLDKVGGTQEDYVIVTDTNLMVTNWLSPSGQFTGYYSARFLDTARDTYYIYGDNSTIIPVTSSHPIATTITSAKKYDFQNKGVVVNVNTTTSPYSTTDNGKASFTLTHVLDNEVSHKTTYDCSPITFTVEIRHEDNKQPHVKTITVIQYPPIYIKQETSNGRVFVNDQGGSASARTTVYNNSNQSIGTITARNGVDDSGENTNPRQYTVYVSVLPAGSTSVIGDPRGPKGGVSNLGTTVSNNYRPTADDRQNVIAPAFKMASSYGKTVDIVYDRAKERCAAYQENGYPAGRWRLPTVAEIDFVVSLSEYDHIPQLYQTGHADNYSSNYRIYDTYWAAGMNAYAGIVYDQDTHRGTYESLSGLSPYNGSVYRKSINNTYYYYTSAVRCVYDVWYWGENQDTSHLTSWGGYQTD